MKLIYSLVAKKTGGASIPCKSLRQAKNLMRISPKNRFFIKGERE